MNFADQLRLTRGYRMPLGETWLRAKVEAHTAETFHRVDPPLLFAAAKDTLRELDRLRDAVSE